MSKKTELINMLHQYIAVATQTEKKYAEIEKLDKSIEYKEERLQEIKSKVDVQIQNLHDKAVKIIEDTMDKVASERSSSAVARLLDAGYQSSLTNVISMLNAGAITNLDDMRAIIEVYKEDYQALAVIKNAAIKGEHSELVHVIPLDNRDKEKKLLNQMRANIDRYISIKYTKDGKMYANGTVEFITSRLDDDLKLLY